MNREDARKDRYEDGVFESIFYILYIFFFLAVNPIRKVKN